MNKLILISLTSLFCLSVLISDAMAFQFRAVRGHSDLTLTTFILKNPRTYAGVPATVIVEAQNTGRGLSPETTVLITGNGINPVEIGIPALASKQRIRHEVIFVFNSGRQVLNAIVDLQRITPDFNRGNNSRSISFHVLPNPNRTRVTGVVADCFTGKGIAGVAVTISGRTVYTDRMGRFLIDCVSVNESQMQIDPGDSGEYYRFWALVNNTEFCAWCIRLPKLRDRINNLGVIYLMTTEMPPPYQPPCLQN